MALNSSNTFRWLLPLTLAVYLSYAIIFGEAISESFATQDPGEFISAIFSFVILNTGGMPFWLGFSLFLFVSLPWMFILLEVILDAIPG